MQEIDDAYTDACAATLIVESERLRVERRLEQALADPDLADRVFELAQRRAALDRELEAARALARALGTAAAWVRTGEVAELTA